MRTIIKNVKEYIVFRVVPLVLACLMLTTSMPLSVFSVSIPDCDCTNTSTDISAHTDSCAKKSYIRNTYIRENTAEQIYSEWNSLDTDVQTAVLTFLSWDDYTKYTALTELIAGGSTDVGYPTTGADKITVDMNIPEGAFPEGTEANVQPIDAKEFCADIETAVSGIDDSSEVLALYAFDISFINNGKELQPSESIGITFAVPADIVPAEARTAHVFHIADDGNAEKIESFYNIDSTNQYTYSVKTKSFSSYVIAYTGQHYKSTLLRDVLKNDPNFSIATIPVTLFDYDADTFNAAIEEKANGSDFFRFTTVTDATFWPNNGATAATMGILKNKLDANTKLPSMMYGYDNAADIFSKQTLPGKTVYDNVQFEFVYNKETGYYEYDSTLNHAQYNKESNRIELYTDTAAPFNYFSQVSYDQIEEFNNITVTEIKEIKKDDGRELVVWTFKTAAPDPNASGNAKYNPFFRINPSSPAIKEENKYLYVRVNSPEDIPGGMKLILYFNDGEYSDPAWGLVDLKKGWNEYFFDLSAYVGKTIDTTGNYYTIEFTHYENGVFEIEPMGLYDDASYVMDMSKAGFYPFMDITNSFPNAYTEFDIAEWKKQFGRSPEDKRATRSYYNTKMGVEPQDCPTDHLFHFGVYLELDFYLPVDYTKDDLNFNFSGDDDMWVFIDDTLVLDVGGAHTRVSGSIAFNADGGGINVTVGSARTIPADGDGKIGSETTLTIDEYTNTLLCKDVMGDDYAGKRHKIRIFYLERASTASNCHFYFNLPTVPTGTVEVTKKVVDESGLVDINNIDFDFKINVDSIPYADREFNVVTYDESGKPISIEARKTDEKGRFKLRHNQTASFADIDENKDVLVTEEPDTRFTANVTSIEKTTQKDTTATFSFVNTVVLTDLVIDKTVSPVTKDDNDFENPSFLFRVKGSGFTENVDIVVSINITANDITDNVGNDSVRITNIPIGSYTVTELTDWSWEYAAVSTANAVNVISFSGETASEITVSIGSINNGNVPTVSFTNTDTDPNWLNGETHEENVFNN